MKKKLISLLLVGTTSALLLTACSSGSDTEASSTEATQEETTTEEVAEEPSAEEAAEESATEEAADSSTTSDLSSESVATEADYEEFGIVDNGDGTLTLTDMAGREVVVPDEINSVYCAVPTGEAMVSTLFPDKLIGWVNEPSDEALEYLSDNLASLPAIGGWMGQTVTANMEDIINLNPDAVIYMETPDAIATDGIADQIAEQTGLPVIAVSSDIYDIPYVYRFLGTCLDSVDRGELLASYSEEKMDHVKELVDAIPEDELKTVYYAENEDGLYTEPTGGEHAAVLDFCNLINIADVEEIGGQGFTPVSIEEIITWDPEVIMVSGSDPGNYDIITDPNGSWADITAVKDGEVYVNPTLPFNWFDRPPNIMRVLGVEWCADVVYPDYVDYDIAEETKDFFNVFYNVDLTDEQVESLIVSKPTE